MNSPYTVCVHKSIFYLLLYNIKILFWDFRNILQILFFVLKNYVHFTYCIFPEKSVYLATTDEGVETVFQFRRLFVLIKVHGTEKEEELL